MPLRAEVVAVGDELLSGARLNGNAAWLGSRLGEVGVDVVRSTVVGDDVEVIAAALREAAARADLVLVTGGLGPTSDDRTREALALALDVPLRRHEPTAARIASWYADRGREPSPAVLHQADLPLGATALRNDVGTAPGIRVLLDSATVVCLPGVPAEATAIVASSLLPDLAARGDAPVATATLRTALVPETVVAERIAGVERRATRAGVRVAYLPSVAEVAVRFVAGAEAGSAGARLVDELAAEAAAALGDVVTVRGEGSLAAVVLTAAGRLGATLAAAESLTGGLVVAALTDVPGASAVVRGGAVAYATDLKAGLLGVDLGLLAAVGPVDPAVALAMAEGARALLGTTHAVATTGVAGPDAQDGHPPGTVHVAVAGPDGSVVVSPRVPGDRARVRSATVVHALELVRRRLLGLPAQDV